MKLSLTAKNKIKKAYNKYHIMIPILSFLWGIWAGFRINHSFSQSWRVLLFFTAFIILFLILSLWLIIYEFLDHKKNIKYKNINLSLKKNALFIDWLTISAIQFFAQYIILFSLPFLFYTQSWFLLVTSCFLALSTLWDPWWGLLIKRIWYQCLIKGFSTILVSSFLISVLFKEYSLFLHNTILIVSVLLISLPWVTIIKSKDFKNKFKSKDFIISLLFLFTIIINMCFSLNIFPILSIWTKSPQIGFDIKNKSLNKTIKNGITYSAFLTNLQNGSQLCCVTPIVAPSHFFTNIIHEWHIDNKLIDKLKIGKIIGMNENNPYRTYSCKSFFPTLKKDTTITCKVLLNDNIEIGKISVDIYQ